MASASPNHVKSSWSKHLFTNNPNLKKLYFSHGGHFENKIIFFFKFWLFVNKCYILSDTESSVCYGIMNQSNEAYIQKKCKRYGK